MAFPFEEAVRGADCFRATFFHFMKRLLFPALVCACIAAPARAQMVTGDRMTDYDTVFGLPTEQKSQNLTVAQIDSSLGANVLPSARENFADIPLAK